MRWIEVLASIFIDTFGITRPDNQTRRRAAWFIFAMMTLVLAGLAFLGVLLLRVIRT